MSINKEMVIEHFKNIQELKEIAAKKSLNIKNDESIPFYEKSEKILSLSIENDFQIELKNKAFLKLFESTSDDQGYIKQLAEININVYTKKDHGLLKDLLKSKGFESNKFQLNDNEPSFSALIGSDSKEGLIKIIAEIDRVCGQNNIFFEVDKESYNDGTSNVELGSSSKILEIALNRIDSPIVIGSKVNEIINFDVKEYNFTMFMKSKKTEFISFDKTEKSVVVDKPNILKDFINKLMNKDSANETSTEQSLVLANHLTNLKENFKKNQKNIKLITGIETQFEPEYHGIMDSKVGLLRSYQLELKRSDRLLKSVIEHQLGKNEINEVEIKKVMNKNSNFKLK